MEDWPPLLAGDIRLEDGFSSPQSTLHPALRPPGAAASIGEVNNIDIMAMMMIIVIIVIIIVIMVIIINILITTLALRPLWRAMWESCGRPGESNVGEWRQEGELLHSVTTICVFS